MYLLFKSLKKFKETEVIREVVQWEKRAKDLANSDRHQRPVKSRVQDDRLKEMFDSGTCLTMHQPWAGLLIKESGFERTNY